VIAPRALPAIVAGLLLAGCAPGDDAPPPDGVRDAPAVVPATADPAGEPVLRVIPRTYLARSESQDWVEEIDRAEAGERFLLVVEPQLRTPAEGPWTLTLAREGAAAVLRLPHLRVDRATGRITFLVRSDGMPPGEYLALLTLEEGGLAAGPERQGFRFRIL